jgi:hypothetical protein
MHQEAFPGEDISDRPEPESVVPAFLCLLAARPESGRHLVERTDPAQGGARGLGGDDRGGRFTHPDHGGRWPGLALVAG